MYSLDLHGTKHEDVRRQVIHFIEDNFNTVGKELEIITGYSKKMHDLTLEVMQEYDLVTNIVKLSEFDDARILFWF